VQSATSGQGVLVVEFLFLFVVLPLAFRFKPFHFPPIPALWLIAGYCFWRLWNDPAFDRRVLWNSQSLPAQLPGVLLTFIVIGALIAVGVYWFRPGLLFNFFRRAPALWAIVMVLYPVASVYPQGIVYRAFLLYRYRLLFPNSILLLVASAAAFSFAHIIFRNPVAVTLTLFGGLLFAWRYTHTNSLFASAFEHALYGCFMFTIGLGEYFYKGAR
jgi:uncharacterized protein